MTQRWANYRPIVCWYEHLFCWFVGFLFQTYFSVRIISCMQESDCVSEYSDQHELRLSHVSKEIRFGFKFYSMRVHKNNFCIASAELDNNNRPQPTV